MKNKLKKNKTMEKFNLEKALAPCTDVQTRNGLPVRIICYDRIDSSAPIVALILFQDDNGNQHEVIAEYNLSGET